jgi:hypothetical protein
VSLLGLYVRGVSLLGLCARCKLARTVCLRVNVCDEWHVSNSGLFYHMRVVVSRRYPTCPSSLPHRPPLTHRPDHRHRRHSRYPTCPSSPPSPPTHPPTLSSPPQARSISPTDPITATAGTHPPTLSPPLTLSPPPQARSISPTDPITATAGTHPPTLSPPPQALTHRPYHRHRRHAQSHRVRTKRTNIRIKAFLPRRGQGLVHTERDWSTLSRTARGDSGRVRYIP